MEVQAQLRITWAKGAAFLDVFEREPPGRYAVVMPGPKRVLEGEGIGRLVPVELEFVDTSRTFRHIARVTSHRPGPPELITFEFLPEQHNVCDLIVWHALGRSIPYLHRRAERKPVWLPVEVEVGDRWRRGFANELSELGMFVTMAEPPARTASARVRIRAGERAWLELSGRVVHARDAGANVGFAMEFAFPTRAEEVRIRNALRAALYATKRS